MASAQGSIGGHFSALVGDQDNELRGSHFYESARSAIYSLLKTLKPKRIYLPNYVCDAVFAAVSAARVEATRYSIEADFEISNHLTVDSDEVFLAVNYFGLGEHAVHTICKTVPAYRVIVDCAQAFFFNENSYLAELYSPRKFLPVADGGILRTGAHPRLDYSDQAAADQSSINRYQYLLQRMVGEPELSRHLYLRAEKELESLGEKGMSRFTQSMIRSVDLAYIRARRRENFTILSELGDLNDLKFELADQVPLCYPLMVRGGKYLRGKLIEHRIFTPTYWPGVVPSSDFEDRLLNDTVYLPIDHRYKEAHIRNLMRLVRQLL